MIATSVGVEEPSDTISVVAQAGAWTASVAIIAQLVATSETVALAASRNPAGENAGAVAEARAGARSATTL